MKCRRCNTTTSAAGVCPHCGWSPSGTDRARDNSRAPGESGPLNLALVQEPPAIDLVDPEPNSSPARELDPSCGGWVPSEHDVKPELLVSWLSRAPDRIEAGLRIATRAPECESGGARSTAGVWFDRPFRDRLGAWVVVALAGKQLEEEWILELRRRMDWVRDHWARAGESVRAIVLVASDTPPPRAAIAALGDTVTFKTWRLAISIEDVEL